MHLLNISVKEVNEMAVPSVYIESIREDRNDKFKFLNEKGFKTVVEKQTADFIIYDLNYLNNDNVYNIFMNFVDHGIAFVCSEKPAIFVAFENDKKYPDLKIDKMIDVQKTTEEVVNRLSAYSYMKRINEIKRDMALKDI
jgi:hypothetical protein